MYWFQFFNKLYSLVALYENHDCSTYFVATLLISVCLFDTEVANKIFLYPSILLP